MTVHDIDPDFTEEVWPAHWRDLRERGSFTLETTHRRKDGRLVPVEMVVNYIEFDGEERNCAFARDISERKQLDRLRDDLMAMIYHDLRSPLANIISSLDILDTLLPEDQAESVRPIFQITTRSADRLQRLISSLLDINRLEAGQPITNRREVDPHPLAEEALEAVRMLAESKGQTLQFEAPASLPAIQADADMLRRVLINLLENAVKFTPEGGDIRVCVGRRDDHLQVKISDTGMGIPREALPRIFERFYRVPRPGKEIKGTGLGLAIVTKIVAAHGGRIDVESEPNKGATFTVSLPIRPHAMATPLTPQADQHLEATLRQNVRGHEA